MKNAIETKLTELQVIEVRSPFQEVARGCLLNALGQIRTAEENLRYHEESQKASKSESEKASSTPVAPVKNLTH